ncbi:hypothetical protein AOG23_29250 [Rhizobium acidisoli]|nr:hypothetical protein AOG23_29250 [Rhizobium acidisoli]
MARAARNGTIPHGSIEDGTLRIDRLTADVPDSAEELILDLYRRMPPVRITDILLEVDAALGFTEAFTHLITGVPCADQIGLLNVLLAEGLNLGLRKMAEATNPHDYWQLSRLAPSHVESDAMDQALAIVVAAQARLPMSRFWGMGTTASSDGQFFPSARQGEARNMVNAKYGNEPGLKAYTRVNDQFAPFASQTIPATVSEAPYILDGLLMNEAGRQVEEQYSDTAGFTQCRLPATLTVFYKIAASASRRLADRITVGSALSERNPVSSCPLYFSISTPWRTGILGHVDLRARDQRYELRHGRCVRCGRRSPQIRGCDRRVLRVRKRE